VVFSVVESGVVTGVTIYDPGYGYGSIPGVSFSGGGGSGAMATIDSLSSGVIRSITVTAGGQNYIAPPTVTTHDATGSGAIAIALLLSPAQAIDRTDLASTDQNIVNWMTPPDGNVASWVRMMDATLPFDSETNIVDEDDMKQDTDFNWSGIPASASAVATLSGGTVSTIKITWGGTNYSSPPTVVINPATSGSGATAHAVLTGSVVTSVVVDTPGSGYVGIPTIQFIGGNT